MMSKIESGSAEPQSPISPIDSNGPSTHNLSQKRNKKTAFQTFASKPESRPENKDKDKGRHSEMSRGDDSSRGSNQTPLKNPRLSKHGTLYLKDYPKGGGPMRRPKNLNIPLNNDMLDV